MWASVFTAASIVLGCDASPMASPEEGVSEIRVEAAEGASAAASSQGGPKVEALTPASATVSVGGTVRLIALGKYGNHVKNATWSSSDAEVAKVTPDGWVTGVASGEATITARTSLGAASARITVGGGGDSSGGGSTGDGGSTGGGSPPPSTPESPPTSMTGVVFQDGFESGALAATQNGYRWRGPSANPGSQVSVSRDIARSGSSSLKFLNGASSRCTHSWAEQRFEFGENLKEVWLEYYIYFPSGKESFATKFEHRTPTKKNSDGSCSSSPNTSDNNKFLRLWDLDYNKFHVKAGFEYRSTQSGPAGDSRLYGMYGSDTKPIGNWAKQNWDPAISDANRGRWMQIRVRAKVADSKSAANGVLQLWADGVLRINLTGLDMAASSGGNNFFRNGYLMGWANSGFDRNTAVYVDDFKIYRGNPGWK